MHPSDPKWVGLCLPWGPPLVLPWGPPLPVLQGSHCLCLFTPLPAGAFQTAGHLAPGGGPHQGPTEPDGSLYQPRCF